MYVYIYISNTSKCLGKCAICFTLAKLSKVYTTPRKGNSHLNFKPGGVGEAFTGFARPSTQNGSPAHSSISETMSFNSSGLVPRRHSEWQGQRVRDSQLPAEAKGRIPKVSISLAQRHKMPQESTSATWGTTVDLLCQCHVLLY